jgi:hypothetical protein
VVWLVDIACTGIVDVPLVVYPVTPVVADAVHAKVAPPTFDVKVTNVLLAPEHMVWVNGVFVTAGVGLTVTVYVLVVPVQLLAVGVIVIVPLIGAVVPLVAVKDDTLPDPLAAKPIAVLLFAHVKADPDTGPDIIVVVAEAPLQYT